MSQSRTKIRVRVLTFTVVALLGAMASPASAQTTSTVAVAAFVGEATTSALWSPVSPNCTEPGGVTPTLCPTPTPGSATWSFTIQSGAYGHYRYRPSGRARAGVDADGIAGAGNLGGGASGTLGAGAVLPGPYCGSSSGTGSGRLEFRTDTVLNNQFGVTATVSPTAASATNVGDPEDIAGLPTVGWQQSAATLIVFQGTVSDDSAWGTGETGPIVGLVSAVPPNPVTDPTGGSCLGGTAFRFRIVGAAAGFTSDVT